MGSFYYLTATASIFSNPEGSIKVRGLPYRFTYTGDIYDGELHNENTGGYYWSRTVSSASVDYYFLVNASIVDPARYSNRYYGFSLRCITTPTS